MKTYSQLIQSSKDYCVDDRADSDNNLSSTETFIKSEINNAIFEIANFLQMFKTQPLPKTTDTVADQQYYQFPIGINTIQSATIEIGGFPKPLTIIHSQDEWDALNMNDSRPALYPLFIFPRRYDFGIYPVPQDAYEISLVGNYYPINLTATDYSTGTVAITTNAAGVTGSGTTWTSAMAGRMFAVTDGTDPITQFYPITTFTSTTSITLQNVWQTATVSGVNYVIAECPDLPDEVQQFIPYRVAAAYSLTRRRDPAMAATYSNMFWTGDPQNSTRKYGIQGGVIGAKRRYQLMGRGNSQLSYQSTGLIDYNVFDPNNSVLS